MNRSCVGLQLRTASTAQIYLTRLARIFSRNFLAFRNRLRLDIPLLAFLDAFTGSLGLQLRSLTSMCSFYFSFSPLALSDQRGVSSCWFFLLTQNKNMKTKEVERPGGRPKCLVWRNEIRIAVIVLGWCISLLLSLPGRCPFQIYTSPQARCGLVWRKGRDPLFIR